METKLNNRIVNQLLTIILNKANPDKVILFGSHARGDAREDSDYDFIILKHNIENEREVTRPVYRELCESSIPVSVDLIAYNSELPKTHSFSVLIAKLENYIEIPKEIREVGELSDYAVQSRYPGDYVEISEREYIKAVKLAEIISPPDIPPRTAPPRIPTGVDAGLLILKSIKNFVNP